MQKSPQNDAAKLVNNMAGLSTQLNDAYMQFMTRTINQDDLRTKILATLNGHYRESLVEPIIKELEIRLTILGNISRVLNVDDFFETLTPDQLVLDSNHHINARQTLKQFYLKKLIDQKKCPMSKCCAIFGFTDLISAHYDQFMLNFSDEKSRNESLYDMFYLSALHGNLEFMTRVWQIAAEYRLEKDLISTNDFAVVAAGQASNNPQIKETMLGFAEKLGIAADIPIFSDEKMIKLYVRANNQPELQACREKFSSTEFKCSLTKEFEMDFLDDDTQEETLLMMLNWLIAEKDNLSHDNWTVYFTAAVCNGSLSIVRKIWEAIEDEPLKIALITEALESVSPYRLHFVKFIIEQAESFKENPIHPFGIGFIQLLIPATTTELRTLLLSSPLFTTTQHEDYTIGKSKELRDRCNLM